MFLTNRTDQSRPSRRVCVQEFHIRSRFTSRVDGHIFVQVLHLWEPQSSAQFALRQGTCLCFTTEVRTTLLMN